MAIVIPENTIKIEEGFFPSKHPKSSARGPDSEQNKVWKEILKNGKGRIVIISMQ